MIEGLSRDEMGAEVANARRALVSTLEALPVDRWDAPSLCAGWSIRDVVAHVLHLFALNRNPLAGAGLVRDGLRVNRYLAAEARRRAAGRSPPELIDALSRAAFERTIVWKVYPWPEFVLVELIVHSQDIRRPLGVDVPPDPAHPMICAEVFGRPVRRFDPFRARLPAVRFEATDAEWSSGDGPVARGPLEAVVMTLAGRRAALRDLTGPGVALLTDHAR
jgi:uncharacterized protein (TIGR03083 family)